MAAWSRAFDVALAASALSWAVLGLLRAHDRPLPVRCGLAAINLLVAVLFLCRRSPLTWGRPLVWLAALPSMVLAAMAIAFADRASWPLAAQIVFLVGAAGTVLSLSRLGRSFAFFPANRGVVASGPYRWVRHPAYLSELLMTIGCLIANPLWVSPVLVVLALGLVWRIHAEEKVLLEDPDYLAYSERVKYRLLPLLY